MIQGLTILSLASALHLNRRISSIDGSKRLLLVSLTCPSVFRHIIIIFHDSLHACWHIPLSSDHSGDRGSTPIVDKQRSGPDLPHLDLSSQNYKHLCHLASKRFNSTKFSNSWRFIQVFQKLTIILEICRELPVRILQLRDSQDQMDPPDSTPIENLAPESAGKISRFRSLRQQYEPDSWHKSNHYAKNLPDQRVAYSWFVPLDYR